MTEHIRFLNNYKKPRALICPPFPGCLGKGIHTKARGFLLSRIEISFHIDNYLK